MHDGVGAPGTPGLAAAQRARRPGFAQRLQHDEIVGEERVRPAQRAHRDVVRGPCADARQRRQRGERRSTSLSGSSRIAPDATAAASADQRSRPRAASRRARRARPARTAAMRAAVGKQPRSARRRRPRRAVRRTPRDAAEQRARGAHRDLLADDRAHRELEAVERAGHAQARDARRRAGPAPPRPPPDRRRGRTRASRATAPPAPRARATATPRRAAPALRGARRTSMRPTCSVAAMRRSQPSAHRRRASTVSTPSIARCRRNASIASQSYGGRNAELERERGRQRARRPAPRAAGPGAIR